MTFFLKREPILGFGLGNQSGTSRTKSKGYPLPFGPSRPFGEGVHPCSPAVNRPNPARVLQYLMVVKTCLS